MTPFTITHEGGYGSQMLAALTGYCKSVEDNSVFCYSSFNTIGVDSKVQDQDVELTELNQIHDKVMEHLGVQHVSTHKSSLQRINHMYSYCTPATFTEEILEPIRSAWPLEKPAALVGPTVVIHVRRGDDIAIRNIRWKSDDYYIDLINKVLTIFHSHNIHIVSWNDPGLKIPTLRDITWHINPDGAGNILEHYNLMVHADVLIVASSTFSISAGFYNKGIVICDEDIFNHINVAFPKQWDDNYHHYLKVPRDFVGDYNCGWIRGEQP